MEESETATLLHNSENLTVNNMELKAVTILGVSDFAVSALFNHNDCLYNSCQNAINQLLWSPGNDSPHFDFMVGKNNLQHKRPAHVLHILMCAKCSEIKPHCLCKASQSKHNN